MPAAMGVKSTTSAKRMLASSNCSAMVRGPDLQRLRDLARQDVEQQHLGALLEEVALAHEVVEQPEHHQHDGAEIEHEEPRDQVVGQARRREIRLDERADHQQHDEAHDPQHGLAQVLDQQRAQRTEGRPQDHRARLAVAASASITRNGRSRMSRSWVKR